MNAPEGSIVARHPALARRLKHLGPPALILLFVTVLLPGQLAGHRPASWDHVVHYTKAVSFAHRLPALDLWGWDWSMYAGYPTEYGYPLTAEVVVTAVFGLALGTISLSHAYALAFFGVYVFGAGAVYWTFSRWIGRTAAALTVFFYLTDYGDFFSGGWFFTVLFGVWPVFLSLAVGLLFLERLVALAQGGDDAPRWPALSGLLGVTLLSHPMQLVLVPLLLVALGLHMTLSADLRNRPAFRRVLRGVGLALPWAFSLAAFWYVPFLVNAAYTQDRGSPGIGPLDLASGLATGHLFAKMVPVAAWAGLAGAIAVWFTRGPARLIGVVCGVGLAAMTSIPRGIVLALTGFDLNQKLEFPRIAMLVKPFWFAAASWMLVAVARYVHRKTGRLGLALFLLAGAGAAVWNHRLFTIMEFPYPMIERTAPELDRMREVGRWLDARADETEAPFRAGHSTVEDHDLVELGTMTRVPLLKFSYTPAVNFLSNLLPVTREIVDVVGMRYLVVPQPVEDPEFVLRARIDPYLIYENPSWHPSPVGVLSGEGAISGVKLGPRAVAFDAAPGAAGRALIAAGYFPNWEATRDGRPVAISSFAIDGARTHSLMTVELAPGHYELTFKRRPYERFAFLLSLAAWLGVAIWGITQTARALGALPNRMGLR